MSDLTASHPSPGWTLLTAGPLRLLVGGPVADPVRAAVAAGGVDAVLDALVASGLRTLPDFVCAEGSRVVVRGPAYAVCSGPAGRLEIRSVPQVPWLEAAVPGWVTDVTLHGPDVPAPSAGPVAVDGWALPAALAAEPAASDPAPEPMVEAAPEPAVEMPSYDHLFGATSHLLPDPVAEPAAIESPGQPGAEAEPVLAAELTLPPPADGDTGWVVPAPAPPATPQPAPPAPAGGVLISAVPWLTPPAAPREEVPAPVVVAPVPPAPVVVPPVPPVPPAPDREPGPAPEPEPAPEPAADGIRQNDPNPPPPNTDDTTTDEDLDALLVTVDRSTLLGASPGPRVPTVLCPAGHPNAPHASTCRQCGTAVASQAVFEMPRPPLGRLVLSTGDVVVLDRGVVLGRAPRVADTLAPADRPHVVKVPSPEHDISRSHVEIVLEGWHVLAKDLGSMNGTTLTLPGHDPQRLPAGEAQVLAPGAVLALADQVSVTYEVDPGGGR